MPKVWIEASNQRGAGIEEAGERLEANPIVGLIVGRVAQSDDAAAIL